MKRVLAIGAHPDDIEYGCGGTLARYVQDGNEVFVLFLTCGEESGDPQIRVNETYTSLKILGIPQSNVFFYNLPDTRIYEHIREAIKIIEEKVKEIEADCVLTNTKKDRHQDHVATGLSTHAACRNVLELIAYETPSTLPTFSPYIYINIQNTIEQKLKAISSHKSQKNKIYLRQEAIKGLAHYRGLQANIPVAESFDIYRIVYL